MLAAKSVKRRQMPICLEAAATGNHDICSAIDRHRQLIGELLLMHGAVLFRGFPVESAAGFEGAVATFSGKAPLDYVGGVSPRRHLEAARVYTSTEYPSEWTIPLHNELSYSSRFPDHVYFCCFLEPAAGGGTTLGDSRRILGRIGDAAANLFRDKQIRYVRSLAGEPGSGYSWQDAFETEDRKTVERACLEAGSEFEWIGECLRISDVRPATTFHPKTGEEVWFNQADGFHISNATGSGCRSRDQQIPRLQAFFGDGTPICPTLIEQVREAVRAETIVHRWQKGDMLILDNRLAAHGREPFAGPRKIAVAMSRTS